MRKPFLISLGLHIGVLLFAVLTFPTFGDKLPPKPTPLPVDLVTPAELTKIKAGERKAKKVAAKSDKKPEPPAKKKAKAPKPTKVKTVKAPPPKPKVKKSEPAPKKAKQPEKKIAKKAPAPKPKPKAKPKKVVKKKPAPKKVSKKSPPAKKKQKNFDPDKIAALLNKVPDSGPKTTAAVPKKKPEPAKGRNDAKDLAMTFNEIDALRAKISQCWNPPVGGLGADAIKVKLRLQLSERGALTRAPEVVNRAGSPFFQAAADAAVRAVMLCQPYQLPARKYALWRDMILNFDPREMFGG